MSWCKRWWWQQEPWFASSRCGNEPEEAIPRGRSVLVWFPLVRFLFSLVVIDIVVLLNRLVVVLYWLRTKRERERERETCVVVVWFATGLTRLWRGIEQREVRSQQPKQEATIFGDQVSML